MAVCNDAFKLRDTFSNEIWLKVLENFKEATEYYNITNASPYFRTLFLPRRNQILFREILKVNMENNGQFQYNWSDSLNNCRLRKVCRSWKEGVDRVVQNPIYYTAFPVEPKVMADINMNDRFQQMSLPSTFEMFERHFDDTHLNPPVNPFLDRRISFPVPLNPRSYKACHRLLQKYGQHIWYCIIVKGDYNGDYQQKKKVYTRIRNLLKLMPNLRALEFFTDTDPDCNCATEISAELTTQLENDVMRNPFPHLPHLSFLRLLCTPLPILRGIIQCNQQIKIVDARSHQTPEAAKVYFNQLPNLSQLGIDHNHENEQYFQVQANVEKICPLAKLWLAIGPRISDVFCTLNNHFSDTLTDLFLFFNPQHLNGNEQLCLPNLKVLHVELYEATSLDFILPLVNNLERLTVTLEWSLAEAELISARDDESTTIKIFEVWKEPHISNAWVLFPKLKLLRMGNENVYDRLHSCSRDQWLNANAAREN